MSSQSKNLSDFDPGDLPPARDLTFGIVVSQWNERITGALLEGALKTLAACGVPEKNIHVHRVPGSFELPLGARWVNDHYAPDAVICLGCVIRGKTSHFDYICRAVTDGIARLNLDTGKPFVFGVLTTENTDQALDRAGGKHGNKGDEAAVTAIRMAALRKELGT